MLPSPLIYENSTAYALPAFRVMVLIDAPLASPEMRSMASQVLEAFLQRLPQKDMWFARSGGKIKSLKPVEVTPKVLATARSWAADADWTWPSTLRFNRWDDELELFSAPHLRIEQRAYLATIQIEMPASDPGLVDMADRISAAVADLPVLWGVMGFGMYQPSAVESLIWMLPRVTPRYRCALEVQPDHVESFLRRTADFNETRHGLAPVFSLPDIGWRTFVGDEFLDRLPDLPALAAAPGITLARGAAFTMIEAGAAPIWGDVNLGEDIAPYRAVARALATCRPEWVNVRDGMFGGYENDNGLDRLEAWYGRFDA